MSHCRVGFLLVLLAWASVNVLGAGVVDAQNTTSESSTTPAISTGPSLQDARYDYRTGRLDDAIREYMQLTSGPKAAAAYAELTHIYLLKTDTADAYATATKAKELDPSAAETRVALGEVYFRQGKLGDAEAEFVAVINSGANSARAYLCLALTSRAVSHYAREKRLLDKAHDLDPTDPDITPEWINTLPPEERTEALKDYLLQGGNGDPDTRKWLQSAIKLRENDPLVDSHPCRMVSNTKASEIDLRPIPDEKDPEGYGLDVTVNGVTSRLLLDTGADGILITKKTAEKGHVTKIFDTRIAGFGDKKPARGYVGHADVLVIGDMEFHDCTVEVIEKGSMSDEGILGPDTFSDFLVDMDMPNKKLRLSELPARPGEAAHPPTLELDPDSASDFRDRYVAPEMKDYTPIFRFGHMLLIPTRVNNLPPRLFVIDTGAYTSIVTPETAREVTKVANEDDVEFDGLSGRVKKLYLGGELTLTFAGLRQTNMDILSFDEKNISDSAGTEISGTLGFRLLVLLDIKIDYRDGLVAFKFEPKNN
jgi:Tfp pilus assembly protein PilF